MSTGSDLLFEHTQKQQVDQYGANLDDNHGVSIITDLHHHHARVELEDYIAGTTQEQEQTAQPDDDHGQDLLRVLESGDLFKPFQGSSKEEGEEEEEESSSVNIVTPTNSQKDAAQLQNREEDSRLLHIQPDSRSLQPLQSLQEECSSGFLHIQPDLALEGSKVTGTGGADHIGNVLLINSEDDKSVENAGVAGEPPMQTSHSGLLEDLAGVIVNNDSTNTGAFVGVPGGPLLFSGSNEEGEISGAEPSKDDGIFSMGILPVVGGGPGGGSGAFGGSQQDSSSVFPGDPRSFLRTLDHFEQQIPFHAAMQPVSSPCALGIRHLSHPPHHQAAHPMHHLPRSLSIGHLPISPAGAIPPFYPGIPLPPSSHLSGLMDASLHGISAPSSIIRRVLSAGDIQPNTTQQGMKNVAGASTTSPAAPQDDPVTKVGRYTPEERKIRIDRYRQKRSERNYIKKIKYACRKTLADSRPRIRGRFAKNQDAGLPQLKRKLEEDDDDDCDLLVEEEEDYIVDKDSSESKQQD